MIEGLTACYLTKDGVPAKQAEARLVSSSIEEMMGFAVVQDPEFADALKLWNSLFKLIEPVSKLVPPALVGDYIGFQSLRQAVDRLSKFIFVDGETLVKSLIGKHGATAWIDEINKLCGAGILPQELQTFVTTMKYAGSWAAGTFAIPDKAFDSPNGDNLQPFLSLFTKIKSFDLEGLKEVLPERYEMASKFLGEYVQLLRKYMGHAADDLKTAKDTLKTLRLVGWTGTGDDL